jgi:hypothetical protein
LQVVQDENTPHYGNITTFMQNVTAPVTNSDNQVHADSSSPARPINHCNNSKYEDIVCHAIKAMYDGSPDILIPFLDSLDLLAG